MLICIAFLETRRHTWKEADFRVPVVLLGEDDQHQHQEVEESPVPPVEMAGLLVVLLELPVFVAGAFLDPFPLPEGECLTKSSSRISNSLLP